MKNKHTIKKIAKAQAIKAVWYWHRIGSPETDTYIFGHLLHEQRSTTDQWEFNKWCERNYSLNSRIQSSQRIPMN